MAHALVTGWICPYRAPDTLQHDGAKEFVSEVLDAVQATMEFDRKITNPYCPWENGIVERMNRTFLQQLRVLCCQEGRQWDRMIPYIFQAYNCSVQKHGMLPLPPGVWGGEAYAIGITIHGVAW